MNKKTTLNLNIFKNKGYIKTLQTIGALLLFFGIFITACKKDTFTGEVVGLCPKVTTDPMDKAVDVVLDKTVTLTFNTAMNAATINKTTFTIKQNGVLVDGTIAATANPAVYTFKPTVPLNPYVLYTGTVTTGARDTLRTALQADYVWTFTSIPNISLTANPTAGGIPNGAGNFAQGSTTTVTATALPTFVFTNWTENGTIVSTSTSYTFKVNGNRALVANFIPIPVGNSSVNLSSSPAVGGNTSGAGAYPTGSSVTVTASANAGYTFTNWTDNNVVVSTSSNYQFTLTGNRTLVANFKLVPSSQFALILSSSPAAGGMTAGEGAYNAGTSVTAKATANTGYNFTNWTENGVVVSTSANYTFALNGNRTLVANFAINVYALNVTAVNGSVSKSPNQANYNYGTNVILTATPNVGYTFSSWSGDASGNANPLTVAMNSDKNITANFVAIPPNNYTLTVTATNGTVTKNPNQPTYNSGTSVQLTATPNAGYTFSSWSGDASGNANPLTVVMNNNKNITANFILIPPSTGTGPILPSLGLAGNFAVLTKSGISTTGITSITGDIGVSPAAATAITGFGLIMDTNGQTSHTPIVTGKVYAAPTPAYLTTAVLNMETAFTSSNNLTVPAPVVNLGAGNLSGLTIPPGLYKFSTGVLITSPVYLNGNANDTWVFTIAQDLTANSGAQIILGPNVQAKNIYWVVSGQAILGTGVDFSGIILSKTLISLNTGAKVTGRLLAQTAVTLNASTVIQPK